MNRILVLCLVFALSFQKSFEKDTCSDFWEEWKEIPCQSSTTEKQTQCFSFNQKVLEISEGVDNSVFIDCNSQTIEKRLYACVSKKYIKVFRIENCILINLDIKDFLSGKTLSSIEVIESGENLTAADVVISDIPSLSNFTMRGHKTRGRFNVSFSRLDNLHSVVITNTRFTRFSSRPFRNIPYLQRLNFTHGILRYVPETLFKGLKNLKALNLCHNRISSLRRGTFNDLASLRELDLTHNSFRVIIGGTFKPLEKLVEVKLSHNPLSYLPDSSPFGSSVELSLVIATNCRLTKNPNVDMMQHNLTLLDFSYNKISVATLPAFGKNATAVNLTNNLIKEVKVNLRKFPSEFPSYYVFNNSIPCNCENEEFLQFLHSDIQEKHGVFADVVDLKCYNRKSVKLLDAWPGDLNCTMRYCPKPCTCLRTHVGIIVDCQDKGLNVTPNLIPFGTVKMLLQKNNISSLSNLDQYTWQKLVDLFLDKNAFVALQHEFIPKKVRKLSVRHNKLTVLPVSLMKEVESTQDYKTFLAGNDWQCVCQNVPFVNWFNRNNHKIKDWNKAFCTGYDDSLSSSPVSGIPVHHLCIDIFPYNTIFFVLILFLLVLLLFLATLFYHRKCILPLLYSYDLYPFYFDKKIVGDGGKEFDVFMFYHRCDIEAAKAIVTKLEPEHRICIPHGEWYPDQAVGHEILRSFECSRKAVLLVSKGLIHSSWFQVEFRAAFYDGMKNMMNRFVLISVGEVGDTEHLKIEIRSFLADKMMFKWKERCFWQKLLFALRHTVRNDKD